MEGPEALLGTADFKRQADPARVFAPLICEVRFPVGRGSAFGNWRF